MHQTRDPLMIDFPALRPQCLSDSAIAVMTAPDRRPLNGPETTRAYALGWLAGAVILASIVFMVLHYRDPIPG